MALYMMQIKYTREAIRHKGNWQQLRRRRSAVNREMWWQTFKLLWACRTRIQYCFNCGI